MPARSSKSSDVLSVFWRDVLIRSCYARDFLYYHGKQSTGREFRRLSRELEKETGLFERMRNYMGSHVMMRHAGEEAAPKTVGFHERWGWTVSSRLGEAHLGKLAISGSPQIIIGVGTYLSAQCTIYGTARIQFGSWCTVADGVEFFPRLSDHQMDFPSLFSFRRNERFQSLVPMLPLENYIRTQDEREKMHVEIGHNVWIARGARILPGVKIGNGAVIGGGSFVKKSCDDFGVYAGVPARKLRDRFRPPVCRQLQDIAWWNWPMDRIVRNARFLDTDLTRFRGKLRSLISE